MSQRWNHWWSLGLVTAAALLIAMLWPNSTPDAPPAESPKAPQANQASPPEPPPRPAPKMGPPTVKEALVDAEKHRFVERSYSPPYVLHRHTAPPQPASLKSAEDAIAAYMSAIRNADWDWWFSMWDARGKSSIQQMIALTTDNTGTGNYQERLVATWKKFYAGRDNELMTRIEVPGYVIVYLRRVGETDTSRDLLAPVVLKQDNGRWVMTHDLQEHIVPNLRITERNVQVHPIP